MLDALAALTKGLLYGALLSAAGTPLAAIWLRPHDALAEHTRRVMRVAAMITIGLTIVMGVLLFLRLGGEFDQPTLTAVFSSGPGAASLLQLTGAAFLLTPTDDDASGRSWLLLGALTMTAAFVFNGHAAAMSPTVGIVAMAHVTAIAWWIGSLWLLSLACKLAAADEIVRLVGRFSWLAVRVVAGLIVAGLVLILALIDFGNSPWLTAYVRVLALKLALVLVVLAIAAYNKVQLTPRLPSEMATLRRSITVELAVIACVLLMTAVLTTYFAPEGES